MLINVPKLSLCGGLCSTGEHAVIHSHGPLVKENLANSVDCTQSQTSTVQCSASLLSQYGAPRSEYYRPDYAAGSRQKRKKKKSWKQWLRHKKWARLADDNDDDDTPVLEKTQLSDDDDDNNVSVRKTTKSPLKVEQTNSRNKKSVTFLQRIREKKRHKDGPAGEPNLSDTDEEELLFLPERAAQFQTPDPNDDPPIDDSLLLAQEMFENASRVLDNELVDIAGLESNSRFVKDSGRVDEDADDKDAIGLLRRELEGAALRAGKTSTRKVEAKKSILRKPVRPKSEGKHDETSTPPPVLEISQHHRGDSGEQSVSPSVVSSLSGSTPLLEYNLETGFKGKNRHLIAMVADIVKNLERAEEKRTETSARCLILLMDPSERIFEIVQVPYILETTTIGEILARLPIVATDRRLARVKFRGFSSKGVLFDAKLVPMQLVLDTQSTSKPIFAVPKGYNSEQIEALGNSLLRSPHVAKLLHDKLANSRRESQVSKNLETKSKSSLQISRRQLGFPLGVINED